MPVDVSVWAEQLCEEIRHRMMSCARRHPGHISEGSVCRKGRRASVQEGTLRRRPSRRMACVRTPEPSRGSPSVWTRSLGCIPICLLSQDVYPLVLLPIIMAKSLSEMPLSWCWCWMKSANLVFRLFVEVLDADAFLA